MVFLGILKDSVFIDDFKLIIKDYDFNLMKPTSNGITFKNLLEE
jgi:hypothetical protein